MLKVSKRLIKKSYTNKQGSYYAEQLSRLSKASDIKVKFTSDVADTHWLNINPESKKDIINFLSII